MSSIAALTIHQPWAWALVYGGKTIENRVWPTRYRGIFAVHAGVKWDPDGENHPLVIEAWQQAFPGSMPTANAEAIVYGAVIGVADLVGCHWCKSQRVPPCSPWAATGQWHWERANPRPLCEPVPARGRQRLWRLPGDLADRVRGGLR